MTQMVECECGEWLGEKCAWSGPIDETVVIEYMPVSLRASHRAAGNWGVYPHNGALRLRVERGCAELLDERDRNYGSPGDRTIHAGRYHTIDDVVRDVRERLGLNGFKRVTDAVRASVRGRYEDIDDRALNRLLRDVWASCVPGSEYPW